METLSEDEGTEDEEEDGEGEDEPSADESAEYPDQEEITPNTAVSSSQADGTRPVYCNRLGVIYEGIAWS